MKKDEKLRKIFNYFGYEEQRRKLNEEIQELNDAILLYEKGIGNIEDVIEEMSDVKNILEEFILEYEIEKQEIDYHQECKMDRTIKRIENGYYGNGKSN